MFKALIALGMKQLTYFELHRLPPNYQKCDTLLLLSIPLTWSFRSFFMSFFWMDWEKHLDLPNCFIWCCFRYLELMLDITAHPSLVLASEIIPFWTKLLSVPYYKEVHIQELIQSPFHFLIKLVYSTCVFLLFVI